MGYQDNFLAFCAADKETGELTGALKDYLEDASVCFSNAQIRYEPIAYPTAAAAMDALKNREVDCMFPANLSTADGEARGFVLTPPVMSTDIYALVRKADSDTFIYLIMVLALCREGAPCHCCLSKQKIPQRGNFFAGKS